MSQTGADGDTTRSAQIPAVAFNGRRGEYLVSVTGADCDLEHRIDFNVVRIAYAPSANEYLAVWSADALATDDELEVFPRRVGAGSPPQPVPTPTPIAPRRPQRVAQRPPRDRAPHAARRRCGGQREQGDLEGEAAAVARAPEAVLELRPRLPAR